MAKESKPEHPSPYLNDLIESIDHQYDPGYWLGGNRTPLLIKYSNMNKRGQKLTGILFILFGLLSFVFSVIPCIENFLDHSFYSSYSLIFSIFLGLVFFIGGINLLMRIRTPKKGKPGR